MANIRIDLEATVINGQTLTFKSPVDCSQITGLKVYYPEGDSTTSKTFQFADAHGNNVGSVSLFAENVLVKVILDTALNRAYVQNADTNAYLEAQLASKAPMEYAKKVGNPYNLLDNSDFTNPVNQRGQTNYSGVGYTIDRWYMSLDSGKLTNNDGYIRLEDATYDLNHIRQKINKKFTKATPVTFVVRAKGSGFGITYYGNSANMMSCDDWTTLVYNYVIPAGTNLAVTLDYNPLITWQKGTTVDVQWAALYEGEYTIDTLPEYQPKGYAAEYAECRRYYRHNVTVNITRHSADYYAVGYEHGMRIAPTVEPTSAVLFGGGAITDMTGASFECTTHKITWALLPAVNDANWTHANFNFNLHADL